MNVKKGSLLLFFSFFVLSIFFMSFASADVASGLDRGLNQITNVISPIAFFFLGEADTGELLLIKFLMAFILFVVLWNVLGNVELFRKGAVRFIISFAIMLMSVRFLTTDLIKFIWFPQSFLGIIIMTFIPFIIYYYFLESFDNSFLRKIGWSAFVIIYAGLAYTRWDQLRINGTQGEWWQNLGWIYLLIAIVSGIMILGDKAIRGYRAHRDRKVRAKPGLIQLRVKYEQEIEKINKAIQEGNIKKDSREYRNLMDRIRDIRKNMKDLDRRID